MNFSFPLLQGHAAANSERIALDPVTGPPVSYDSLADRVAVRADCLSRVHGERRPVALQLDHGLDEAVIELAALKAGIPVLSLPTFFTADQTNHAISECGAQPLFRSPLKGGWAPQCAVPIPLPRGTARITFTSGSTGNPLGVCLSEEHMFTVAASVVETIGMRHAGRHLALLPPGILLETVAGFFATMLAGGTYICPPQSIVGLANPFRPDFAKMARGIAEWRITSLILVPEYLSGLVEIMERSQIRLPLLTVVAVGGAHTSTSLLARARALGLPVRQGYGLTECGSVISIDDGVGASPGSAGRPLRHIRAKIAEDGEILLDGALCLGTVGKERAAGWLATGDIGRIDDAGKLWIEGRKSSLIVTSFGRNISPEWVEAALVAQPEIAQAMVHGDDRPTLEGLLVPSGPTVDLARAVAAANAVLPAYARISAWQEVAPFTAEKGQLTGNGRLRRSVIAKAYLDGEPAFFTQLETSTLRHRMEFLAVPQVRAGLAGQISLADYVSYLTQAWHHVRHTVPLLLAARARLGHRAELVAAIDGYIEEETGHDDWILGDIAAAGGDADAARLSDPAPATHAMVWPSP